MIKLYGNWKKLRAITNRGVFDCLIGAWHLTGMQNDMDKLLKRAKK